MIESKKLKYMLVFWELCKNKLILENKVDCLIIHVHGFGGEDYSEKFISLVRNFTKTIHLENKIFATTHTWDSEILSPKIIGKNWTRAQEKAEKEVPIFIEKLLVCSKNYDNIYISAFSLGSKVVSMAIKKMDILPPSLKGIFFLGSALEKDFRFDKVLPFKIINYYSDNNDKVLKNIYKAMEAKSAGGEVGFLDSKNFLNLYTNCSHAIFYRNYKKYVPQIIVSFIAVWNNLQIQNKQILSNQSNKKKIKIKINEKKLNLILIINNIAIYQTLPKLQKEKYFVANLEKDANYAYSFLRKSSDLIALLKAYDITYDTILNNEYTPTPTTRQELKRDQIVERQLEPGKHTSIDESRKNIYSTIFKMPIINVKNPKKSFYIKLIYKLPINKMCFEDYDKIKNLIRFTKIDDTSYFSKLEIATNNEFREATDGVFIWKEANGIELPLVYNFDFSFFRSSNILELVSPKLETKCRLILKKIDLIPTTKNYAYLSFTVEGGTTTVEDHLKLVSKHLFGKMYIKKTGNKEFDNIGITLSGLKDYIQQSIINKKEANIKILANKSSGERPLIMQYLLLKPKFADIDNQILNSAVNLLGTFSSPNIQSPKIEPHIWQSEQAAETIFSNLENYGTSAICSSTNEFNCDHQSVIFMRANYFQKILAEEIKDKETREIVKNCFKEQIRKQMFENML